MASFSQRDEPARAAQEGGDAGQGLHADGDWPTPASTGALTTVPEAAVMHVHPFVLPASKYPAPSLERKALFTNQLAEEEILENELTPFELNCPCAQNW
jgi:hypothetical protein